MQQLGMFENKTHKVDDSIVSIHEPHVRLILREKARAKTGLGAKIHLSIVDDYFFLDKVSWNVYNDSS